MNVGLEKHIKRRVYKEREDSHPRDSDGDDREDNVTENLATLTTTGAGAEVGLSAVSCLADTGDGGEDSQEDSQTDTDNAG